MGASRYELDMYRACRQVFAVVFDRVLETPPCRSMGDTQRPINLSQWRGKHYGATNSNSLEISSVIDGQDACCEKCRVGVSPFTCPARTCHCLQEDSEYWYEARVCFPCVLDAKDYFVRKVPFIKWLRRYSPSKLLSDVIAGMTVGLMVVPQALAYAKIAGLPLEVRHSCSHSVACASNAYQALARGDALVPRNRADTRAQAYIDKHAHMQAHLYPTLTHCTHLSDPLLSLSSCGCSMAFTLHSWGALSTSSWGLLRMSLLGQQPLCLSSSPPFLRVVVLPRQPIPSMQWHSASCVASFS